jgi:K+ transporter
MEGWTDDIERVLEEIRMNAVQLSNNHKQNYFFYKSLHKYFRIPTIVLSSVASVSAIGLQNYISQAHISGIVCLLGLSISVVNSI